MEIVKGMLLPPKSKYNFADMEIGDALLFDTRGDAQKAASSAESWRRAHERRRNRRFSARAITEGPHAGKFALFRLADREPASSLPATTSPRMIRSPATLQAEALQVGESFVTNQWKYANGLAAVAAKWAKYWPGRRYRFHMAEGGVKVVRVE
jgi:hypothetical protein